MYKVNRGEPELQCLNAVKNYLFSEREIATKEIHIDKYALDSEQARMWDKRDRINQSYFGLGINEQEEFEQIILSCVPNPESSSFPDFISNKGIIEHFIVSSSATTGKKGSKQLQNDSLAEKTLDEVIHKIVVDNKTNNNFALYSASVESAIAEHSYCYFKNSFEKCWNKHIQHLESYLASNESLPCIFLIDYPDGLLKMNELRYQGFPEGYKWGSLDYCQISTPGKWYRLAYDQELLRFIKKHQNLIKYVVFNGNVGVDVICTEQIDNIISLLPYPMEIHPVNMFKQKNVIFSVDPNI